MTVNGEEKNFEIDDLYKLLFSSLLNNWYGKNSYYYNLPFSLSCITKFSILKWIYKKIQEVKKLFYKSEHGK